MSDPEKQPSLRAKLNEHTRTLIVEAMVEQLGETGVIDFSVFEIARRAGISPRTIYRHFPTREDMFDAMSRMVNERVGFPDYATTPQGIADLARKLFPAFDENEALILAQMQTPTGQTVRAHARKERASTMRRAVDSIAPDLSEDERNAFAAVCHCVMSADAWRRMRTDFDLDGESSGEAAGWALETLFAAIEQRNQQRKNGKGND